MYRTSIAFVLVAVVSVLLLPRAFEARGATAFAAPANRAIPDVSPSSIVNLNVPGYQVEPWVVENGKPGIFYSVPRDHWFILTDLRVESGDVGPVSLVTTGRGTLTIHLPLLHRGEPETFDYQSNVGIAFPPGSQLGILLDSSDGPATAIIDLNMTGYLRRE